MRFITLILSFIALTCQAQTDSALYAMAVDQYYRGGTGDTEILHYHAADSLITVLLARGGDEPQYYHARGLARQRIADDAYAEGNFMRKDAEMSRMFEAAISDLEKARDKALAAGFELGNRDWQRYLENDITSMRNSMK